MVLPLNMPTVKEQNSLQYTSTHTVAITDITVATQYMCKVTIMSASQYIIGNDNSIATNLTIICKL